MIRHQSLFSFVVCATLSVLAVSAQAQAAKPAAKPVAAGANQVLLLETAQRWQAFATQGTGKARNCYALSKARERKPANLKDVEGLLFISNRPAESVKNEISLVMNFDLKENVEHIAQIGEAKFALVASGKTLWLRNPAEEGRMLDAMRRANEMEVRATSKKGNPTADKYALQGMAQVVKKAEDTCK
jgi:phosphate-selective porin